MAEYIRSIIVTVVVDTNKRTINLERDLSNVLQISEAAESMQEEVEAMLS